jgi:hypothetical protein
MCPCSPGASHLRPWSLVDIFGSWQTRTFAARRAPVTDTPQCTFKIIRVLRGSFVAWNVQRLPCGLGGIFKSFVARPMSVKRMSQFHYHILSWVDFDYFGRFWNFCGISKANDISEECIQGRQYTKAQRRAYLYGYQSKIRQTRWSFHQAHFENGRLSAGSYGIGT